MRSLWPQLAVWVDAGESFALATVTSVSGSAPRAPGACMAIMPESLRFIGSVSSGCLDAEVVDAARAALKTRATQHLRFGPDGAAPWTDGLTCGGWITVRIEPWWGGRTEAVATMASDWLRHDEPGVIISSDEHHLAINSAGTMVGDVAKFSAAVVQQARDDLAAERMPHEIVTSAGRILVRTMRRRPRLLMVGAVDVAVHLVAIAHELGFSTTVIDPRAAFATAERFRVAPDVLRRAWPGDDITAAGFGARDAALVLTHDPKIDDAALLALLKTSVGYIGALGSQSSHAKRLERLRAAGADPMTLDRIHGPAGIHLGTPDAAGIALGIAAGLARWHAERERPADVK